MRRETLALWGLMAVIAAGATALAGEKKPTWSGELVSEQGKFAVSVKPAEKLVEVRRIEGGGATPPHLRLRVLRENDRPFELRLHLTEPPGQPLFYTGRLKQWNESNAGVELDLSFDSKTWKRLGRVLRKAVP